MKRGSSKTRSGKVEHATFQCSSGKNAAKALKTSAGGIECGTETASRIINGAKVAAKARIYELMQNQLVTSIASKIDKDSIIAFENPVEELPWMISIRDYLGFPFCGGTILTPEYSITAAHCREFRRLKEYKITTGHLERGRFYNLYPSFQPFNGIFRVQSSQTGRRIPRISASRFYFSSKMGRD